jgi:AraC family transcriptional regulator, transcriptional activator of pobA
MKPSPLLLVPYREVRHDQPDDCLHYEQVAVRGAEMDWTIPAHCHEGLHQFQLLAQGSVEGTIDGRAFRADAPVLLMLAPGSVHGFTYTRNAVGHQVTMPTAMLRQLLGALAASDGALAASFVVDAPDATAVDDLLRGFEAVAREFRADAPGRVQALLAHATVMAVQFLRLQRQHEGADKPKGARDTLVQRYRALLETHYRAQQSLAFYANALRVTPDHLSRSCRNVAGVSAQELLHDRLMLEARRLLAYTPAPVAEIASQLGYVDPAYFSKFFARRVGSTPTAYRQLVASGVRGLAP